MKKTILIGAMALLKGLVDDANPVVVIDSFHSVSGLWQVVKREKKK